MLHLTFHVVYSYYYKVSPNNSDSLSYVSDNYGKHLFGCGMLFLTQLVLCVLCGAYKVWNRILNCRFI